MTIVSDPLRVIDVLSAGALDAAAPPASPAAGAAVGCGSVRVHPARQNTASAAIPSGRPIKVSSKSSGAATLPPACDGYVTVSVEGRSGLRRGRWQAQLAARCGVTRCGEK